MANRLQEIYDELRAEGVVSTQIEFASLLGVNRTTISAAMNEIGKAYNPKIVARAEQFYKNYKGTAYTPAPPRKEIVIPPETMELYTNLSRTAAQLAETLDRLLSGETKKGAV